MNMNLAFGEIIRNIRKSLGLTQVQLAELSGLDDKYVSDIERAFKNPTLKTMTSLAEGLNIPLSELIKQAESRFDVT